MSVADTAPINALLDQAARLTAEVAGQAGATPEAAPPPPAEAAGPTAPSAPVVLPPELRRILRLRVPVIVQLAERQTSMKEVLDMNVGSIIEFYRPFDAELDLIVANRRIGMGKAVKVGENFGLRITRIGTIHDTIKALGG